MGKLKKGYTTGTCAAIASKAAARMLISGMIPKSEGVVTPSGETVTALLTDAHFDGDTAVCAVQKYAGDDPDITDGLLIYSRVRLCGKDIRIDGGKGVGRVTKPGLEQPVGEAAINSVPRRMITEAVYDVMDEYGTESGAEIVISVPGGDKAALKTFNPRLGIEGGISILGTTGIVEPMSTNALIDTISVELSFKKANGHTFALVTPGNYGRDYIMQNIGLDIDAAVKCGNFIGEAIDLAADKGFAGILLIGHAGKLIKLAAGIMNTHSRIADGRAEVLCANAALEGVLRDKLERIMESVTTDDAVSVLKECGALEKVMKRIAARIDHYIGKRCAGRIEHAFIVFSNVYGELCRGGSESVIKETINEGLSYRNGNGRRGNADRGGA